MSRYKITWKTEGWGESFVNAKDEKSARQLAESLNDMFYQEDKEKQIVIHKIEKVPYDRTNTRRLRKSVKK